MKKLFYFAALALAATSIAACSSTSKTETKEETRPTKEVFSGILPAADTDGVRYTLKLDYENDSTFTSGKYDLDETYLKADTTSTSGYKDMESFKTKGDFSVMAGDGVNAGKSYLKLVAEKSATDTVAPMPMYFLIDSDSTITMVNAELEPSVSPDLNYTLKLDK